MNCVWDELDYSDTPESEDFKEEIGNRKVETSNELFLIYSHEPRRRSVSNLPRSGSPSLELEGDFVFPH